MIIINLISLHLLKVMPLKMTWLTDFTVNLPDSWQVIVTALDDDISRWLILVAKNWLVRIWFSEINFIVTFDLLRRSNLDDNCESVRQGCSMQSAWSISGEICMTLHITGLIQSTTSNLMKIFIVFTISSDQVILCLAYLLNYIHAAWLQLCLTNTKVSCIHTTYFLVPSIHKF